MKNLYRHTLPTPLGPLTAVASARGLVALRFGTNPAEARGAHPDPRRFSRFEGELRRYFAGKLRTFRTPLDLSGTAWELRVWKALRGIPHGTTRTYGEVARAIGSPGAARAVGGANGRNPVAILVPCHRVVAAGGALGGYSAGTGKKRFLLDLEAGARRRRR